VRKHISRNYPCVKKYKMWYTQDSLLDRQNIYITRVVYSYKGYNRSLKKTRFQKCFEKNLRKSQWHYWFIKVILLKRSDSDLVTIVMLFKLIQMVWCGFAPYIFLLNLNLVFFFSVILWVIWLRVTLVVHV
jgi:hypothetical protein